MNVYHQAVTISKQRLYARFCKNVMARPLFVLLNWCRSNSKLIACSFIEHCCFTQKENRSFKTKRDAVGFTTDPIIQICFCIQVSLLLQSFCVYTNNFILAQCDAVRLCAAPFHAVGWNVCLTSWICLI